MATIERDFAHATDRPAVHSQHGAGHDHGAPSPQAHSVLGPSARRAQHPHLLLDTNGPAESASPTQRAGPDPPPTPHRNLATPSLISVTPSTASARSSSTRRPWLQFAAATAAGKTHAGTRKQNQDCVLVQLRLAGRSNVHLFAVFDGHGPHGHHVSSFAARSVRDELAREINSPDAPPQLRDASLPLRRSTGTPQQPGTQPAGGSSLSGAGSSEGAGDRGANDLRTFARMIRRAVRRTETALFNQVEFDAQLSGTTMAMVLLIGTHAIIASVGDSRAAAVYLAHPSPDSTPVPSPVPDNDTQSPTTARPRAANRMARAGSPNASLNPSTTTPDDHQYWTSEHVSPSSGGAKPADISGEHADNPPGTDAASAYAAPLHLHVRSVTAPAVSGGVLDPTHDQAATATQVTGDGASGSLGAGEHMSTDSPQGGVAVFVSGSERSLSRDMAKRTEGGGTGACALTPGVVAASTHGTTGGGHGGPLGALHALFGAGYAGNPRIFPRSLTTGPAVRTNQVLPAPLARLTGSGSIVVHAGLHAARVLAEHVHSSPTPPHLHDVSPPQHVQQPSAIEVAARATRVSAVAPSSSSSSFPYDATVVVAARGVTTGSGGGEMPVRSTSSDTRESPGTHKDCDSHGTRPAQARAERQDTDAGTSPEGRHTQSGRRHAGLAGSAGGDQATTATGASELLHAAREHVSAPGVATTLFTAFARRLSAMHVTGTSASEERYDARYSATEPGGSRHRERVIHDHDDDDNEGAIAVARDPRAVSALGLGADRAAPTLPVLQHPQQRVVGDGTGDAEREYSTSSRSRSTSGPRESHESHSTSATTADLRDPIVEVHTPASARGREPAHVMTVPVQRATTVVADRPGKALSSEFDFDNVLRATDTNMGPPLGPSVPSAISTVAPASMLTAPARPSLARAYSGMAPVPAARQHVTDSAPPLSAGNLATTSMHAHHDGGRDRHVSTSHTVADAAVGGQQVVKDADVTWLRAPTSQPHASAQRDMPRGGREDIEHDLQHATATAPERALDPTCDSGLPSRNDSISTAAASQDMTPTASGTAATKAVGTTISGEPHAALASTNTATNGTHSTLAQSAIARSRRGRDRTPNLLQLTQDHKPSDHTELARILRSGGIVARMRMANGREHGPVRVWKPHTSPPLPGLAMSRSIGDGLGTSVGVICDPLVSYRKLDKHTDRALVIASDGLWDVANPEWVASEACAHSDATTGARALCTGAEEAWADSPSRGQDDVTVVLLLLWPDEEAL